MDIKTYLSTENLSRKAFADRVGMKPTYLNQIIIRHRMPSIGLSARIIEASGGKITIEDLRPELKK